MTEPIALIGAGVIGQRHLQALNATSKAQLVAIVDPAPNAADLASSHGIPHFCDITQMLQETNPSGLIIATPTEHHLAPALTGLDHGCHLLIEKPITASLDEATQITAKAASTYRHVLVGHHRRYYPQIEQARTIVQNGTLGTLVAVSGQWCVRKHESYFEPDWRKQWHAGPILTNLVHEIDYLRYICGPIDRIQAETSHQIRGFDKEDAAAFILRFKNGALGAFVISDQTDSPWAWEFASGENPLYPRSGQNCLRFIGTKAALDFPNLATWQSTGPNQTWHEPKSATHQPMELGDAFVNQINHFADVIQGTAAPKITAQDATQTLQATLAVLQAASTGTRINLA